MSGSVQAQLNAAFAQIGRVFGGPYQQYRQGGPSNPISAGNLVGTVTAGFDTTAMLTFRAPAKFANPLYYAATDPTPLQPGDYLVGQIGTLFVTDIEPNKPALCVRCNRVVSISRPDANATAPTPTFGEQPAYSGGGPTQTLPIITGWPASVDQGTKGERSQTGLPDDTRQPWVAVLLPLISGVVIRNDDQMTDDFGHRYVLSSCEETPLGWRLTATLATT